jgi:hypothetical protein
MKTTGRGAGQWRRTLKGSAMRDFAGFHPRCENDERAHNARLSLEIARMTFSPPRVNFSARVRRARFGWRWLFNSLARLDPAMNA